MAQLLEYRILNCPYHRARRYLADSIAGYAESGEETSLRLSATAGGMQFSKDVIVTYGTQPDPMHFDQIWHVHWKPTNGPYPEFDGELSVRGDESYKSAILELNGMYRPPGGAFGAAFDWAAGSKIAKTTANELLTRLASEMERRYEREERAKRASIDK